MLFGLTPELTQKGGVRSQTPLRPGLLCLLSADLALLSAPAQPPPPLGSLSGDGGPCSSAPQCLCLPRSTRRLLTPWLSLPEGRTCAELLRFARASREPERELSQWDLLRLPVPGTQAPSVARRDPTRLGNTKPVLRRREATSMKSPPVATRDRPCLPQVERACVWQRRPSVAKINCKWMSDCVPVSRASPGRPLCLDWAAAFGVCSPPGASLGFKASELGSPQFCWFPLFLLCFVSQG